MFFFDAIPWYNVMMWFVVFGLLIGLNEFVRSSKWASVLMFMVVLIVLTPIWLSMGDVDLTSWFHWVKVYSALVVSLIYMVIRSDLGRVGLYVRRCLACLLF